MIYKSQYTKGTATLQFPFNLSRKNYYRNIIPYVRYELQTIHDYHNKNAYLLSNRRWQSIPTNHPYVGIIGKPDNITLQIMRYGLILSNQTRMSERDINPRWGQRLTFGYQHTPFENLDYGNSTWVEGRFYFPGFAPHHSFSLYLGHQNKSLKDRSYYSNQIQSPHGISLYGYDLSTLHTTYRMPICYPDAHVGPILYMKRITAAAFFDVGHEKNQYYKKTFYSYGIEATVDTHFFRLPFPMNLGFRLGYETKKQSMFADMIFSVSFTI